MPALSSLTIGAIRPHPAVAVQNDAARGGERNGPQPVRLGLQLVLAVLQDLGAEERHRQHPHRRPQDAPGHAQPAVEQVRVIRVHTSLRRIAR